MQPGTADLAHNAPASARFVSALALIVLPFPAACTDGEVEDVPPAAFAEA